MHVRECVCAVRVSLCNVSREVVSVAICSTNFQAFAPGSSGATPVGTDSKGVSYYYFPHFLSEFRLYYCGDGGNRCVHVVFCTLCTLCACVCVCVCVRVCYSVWLFKPVLLLCVCV